MSRMQLVIGLVVLMSFVSVPSTRAVTIDHSSFERTWAYTDKAIADGRVTRTWMWGPEPFTERLIEPYWNSPSGWRAVQFFDKSRMEITDPNADSSALWYVSNGLLAKELITGQMQLGHEMFENYAPAEVNVAGDPDDANGPTYATFWKILDEPPAAIGATITGTINRAGETAMDPSLAGYGVTAAVLVPETQHTVASVFWEFMNRSGLVYTDGQFQEGLLFENSYYATGLPLTEARWTTVKVGGVAKQVLVQVFERRVMTYTPDNPEEWRVEAGNVGQHYYRWRYEQLRHVTVARPELVTMTPTWRACDSQFFNPYIETSGPPGQSSAGTYYGEVVTIAYVGTVCSIFHESLGIFWDQILGEAEVYAGESATGTPIDHAPFSDLTILVEPGNTHGWPPDWDSCAVDRIYKRWHLIDRFERLTYFVAPGPAWVYDSIVQTDPPVNLHSEVICHD